MPNQRIEDRHLRVSPATNQPQLSWISDGRAARNHARHGVRLSSRSCAVDPTGPRSTVPTRHGIHQGSRALPELDLIRVHAQDLPHVLRGVGVGALGVHVALVRRTQWRARAGHRPTSLMLDGVRHPTLHGLRRGVGQSSAHAGRRTDVLAGIAHQRSHRRSRPSPTARRMGHVRENRENPGGHSSTLSHSALKSGQRQAGADRSLDAFFEGCTLGVHRSRGFPGSSVSSSITSVGAAFAPAVDFTVFSARSRIGAPARKMSTSRS